MLCYVIMMQEKHQHRNIRCILQAHHIDVGYCTLKAKHCLIDLQIYMHAFTQIYKAVCIYGIMHRFVDSNHSFFFCKYQYICEKVE